MYLAKEAVLSAIVHRMKLRADYRPNRYPPGDAGVAQALEHLEDVKEMLQDVKTEGDG